MANVKDIKDIGTLVLIGVGIYAIYSLTHKAPDKLKEIGEGLGEALFDFFHPDPVGETYYFTVTFPDTSKHAIARSQVTSDRTFVNSGNGLNYDGDGKTYKLYDNAQGQHFAIPV